MNQQPDPVAQALLDAMMQTLENMAFEEVELLSNKEAVTSSNPNTQNLCWASLPILKPSSGEMVLSMSPECARKITQDIYGIPENSHLDEGSELDAIGEILNIIAGRFLHALIPSHQMFELGLPNTGRGPGNLTSISNPIAKVVINLGGYEVIATISGDDFKRLLKTKSQAMETCP
jgi:CheY-specific phosphatase CheX